MTIQEWAKTVYDIKWGKEELTIKCDYSSIDKRQYNIRVARKGLQGLRIRKTWDQAFTCPLPD